MSNLKLELSQKLHMTQQLAQAVKLLAMSGQEINDLVDKEVLENPVLELDTPVNLDNRWNQSFSPSTDNKDAFYALAEQEKSLQDHLIEQVFLVLSNSFEKEIAQYIIGSLNESGYLEQSPIQIAKKFKTELSTIEKVRSVIKDVEPIGFSSINLPEFLILQLENLEPTNLTKLAITIVKNHLANLSQGDFESIAMATDADFEDVKKAVDIIKGLNPRPVNAWTNQAQTQYIVPDILIEKVENKYIVSLNPIYTRSLKIHDEYTHMRKSVDKDTRRYISKNFISAKWLIHCLEQREKNIRQISELLVELQTDFLDKGFLYMKPLTLKIIAQITGLHESTVSRTVSNKYAQTPQGTISLKDFFPSGLPTLSGEKVSSAHIKKRIADIIKKHGKISDQKISDILKEEGVYIARRTVAKYRSQTGIKSSFNRKT